MLTELQPHLPHTTIILVDGEMFAGMAAGSYSHLIISVGLLEEIQ